MTVNTVPLPGPVVLVPGRSLEAQLDGNGDPGPGVPRDPEEIVADLNSRPDGVPLTVTPPQGKRGAGMVAYATGYVVKLSPGARRDCYFINGVHPMTMQHHRALTEGYVLVKPSSWQFVHAPGAVPRGTDAGWAEIEEAWAQRGGGLRTAATIGRRTPAHHEAFLDRLDQLIDAGQSLEIDRQQASPGFPYRDVVATGGRRDGTRSVYEFRLSGDRSPEVGAYVHVRGATDQRGQVTRTDGTAVTVRFDDPVDWSALSAQGVLQPTPNTTVYRRQRAAVEWLRTGRTAAPGLLETLVDHRTQPFTPSTAMPLEGLDPEQLEAFQRALSVPDMLAVL
ncbi:MAG TPA: hypothetical protein VLH10_04635, partial [Yinghuangia sp.]|nr:hypothetical protein [Yinghuangia sp.]